MRLTRNEKTQRIEKPSFAVRAGDEIVFSYGDRLRIIKIIQCGLRRGPATEARALYDDASPPPPPKKEKPISPAAREKGAGRPTKKERRKIESLRSGMLPSD